MPTTNHALNMETNDLNLADLTKARDSAQEDLDLYRRMMTAEQRLAGAQRALDDAQRAADKQEESAAKEEYEAQFAGISGMQITRKGPNDVGILKAEYEVTYLKMAWDEYSNMSIPRRYTRTIASLSHGELLYLIERASDQIPAPILALAPGSPSKAIGRYLQARRTGYLS